MLYYAGIAAENYSHVRYFPCRTDYDIFYAILLRVADIAVLSFASIMQKLIVDFLRAKDDRSALNRQPGMRSSGLVPVADIASVTQDTVVATTTWESR